MPEDSAKKYWRDIDERDADTGAPYAADDPRGESPESKVGSFNRRTFLQAAGFTIALAAITGCSRAPVKKAITYIEHPEGFVPGRSENYASICGACPAGCGILIKSRDGRPIKLEGNPIHPVSKGAMCAVGQASILGLYDSHRLTGPLSGGAETSWDAIDDEIKTKLDDIRSAGGSVRILTGTVNSPTSRRVIDSFLKTFVGAKHVTYDALSSSAISDAYSITHGTRIVPRYKFENADIIVGFDADFLGTWISPVEYASAYGRNRVPDAESRSMSRHVQFESILTVTGSNADERFRIAPADSAKILRGLAASLAKHSGIANLVSVDLPDSVSHGDIENLADRLIHSEGRSLVLCGSQDVNDQVVCNFINYLLGNYGNTIDLAHPSYQKLGNDSELDELIKDIYAGRIDALILNGVNPVFELPGGEAFADAIKRLPLVISTSDRIDETAETASVVCPDTHFLESWSDSEPVNGVAGIIQPGVGRIGDTRQFIESLSVWMGERKSAYDLVRETWETKYFPRQVFRPAFQAFWDNTLHDGVANYQAEPVRTSLPVVANLLGALSTPGQNPQGYSIVLYPKVAMREGSHSYNPWLQEMPDPISKMTWDNYACVSPSDAEKLNVSEGDVVRIDVPSPSDGNDSIELPVHIQPGTANSTIGIALGYGGKDTSRFAKVGPEWFEGKDTVGENGLVGTNAAHLLTITDGSIRYTRSGAAVTPTGRNHTLATTQKYDSLTIPEKLTLPGMAHRPIIEETTFDEYLKNPRSGSHAHNFGEKDLWPDHAYTGHHWAMAIDLNRCNGCSACVIGCQVENNIPVVGRDEIHRHRDLHWIRIDRYYSGDGDDVDVAFQPMLCAQCDNAPCETVCPVLATVHSSEGLSMQVYNRCVGTRYCANNCPYKVRRFNWFNYSRDSELENMSLNPDVTVRTRGVMEKCTFCVQRIQDAKIRAKADGRELLDGEIKPACQQTCPSGAIVFGDLNDPDSEVSKLMADSRRYKVLEELNILPSIGYLRMVRNRDGHGGGSDHV